jgi:ferrous iron transport protein A
MGFLPEQIILVVKNGHPGPLVVKVKESKIVLGRGMSQKIKVEKI